MPIITVSQAIRTVGWTEATQTAPAEIMEFARVQSNSAIPFMIGKTNEGDWVVIGLYTDASNTWIARIDRTVTPKPEAGHEPPKA